MKTETKVVSCLSLLALALLLLLQTQTTSQQLWGEISATDGKEQLILYQKDRRMHQTPEILLYSQHKDTQTTRYLGCINLPEDNRSAIRYTYEWEDEQQLILRLECDYCMIEQRRYRIALAQQVPYCITPLSTLAVKP